MRILLIGLNFAPEPTGVGKYSGEMAEWLTRRGHSVVAVTAPPYYPAWKIAAPYRAWTWHRERGSTGEIIRCPLYVPAQPSGAKRLLHLTSFGLSSAFPALIAALQLKPDVVATVVPTLCAVPAALAAARLTRTRSWVHVQDLEVDAAFDLGILAHAPLRRAALAAERALLSRFDLVSSVSEAMVKRLAAKGVAPGRLALFPNWVDTAKIVPQATNGGLRKEFGIPEGKVVALYSGSMGEKHGLELIVSAATLLAGQAIHFVIAGDGPGKAAIAAAAAKLPNVTLLPLQPSETLGAFLAMADIHLLPQRADAAELVMPSKLGAMLASGRPVIAMATPRSQIGQRIASCGRLVTPGDAAGLAGVLVELAQDRCRRKELGRAARAVAMAWSQDVVLTALEARLVELMRLSSSPPAEIVADDEVTRSGGV